MIDFFYPCVPPKTTAQQKRMNKATGAFFKSAKMEEAQATFSQILCQHDQKPAKAISGPVALQIEVTWPWRSSDGKKTREKGRIPHTSKPDLDNWVKMLTDELVRWRWIEADQSVCELTARKFYGEAPGIRVALTPIEVKA